MPFVAPSPPLAAVAGERVFVGAFSLAPRRPWTLLACASDRGLLRLQFDVEGDLEASRIVDAEPGQRGRLEVVPGGELLDGFFAELEGYFAGTVRDFRTPVDLEASGTPFQRRVWSELCRIPFGETISYGELARRVGRAGGARAVGQANGRNPVPVVVPCHRVVAADGGLGGFSAGLEIKRLLLELEGSTPR